MGTWAENWGAPPLFGVGLGPCLTQSPGLRLTFIPSGILIHPAIWPQQISAENWGLCPFGGGGAGSPSNTMWPGLRPTCMPSVILDPSNRLATLHQRHRQDRQTDRQTTV